ncbi:hypothetical protein [Halopiger goleimassiliensis]|uniref:hypothetical protein n=1 Tax=Halopiger goleimassiliensis TaxID=1293048 RepID=UPI0006781F31|nr:hypothetical protein [Halopiger goleimassiliensis]
MIRTRDTDVPFDEFSRTCDLVDAYFGETIDDVALHAPVSRRQLVAVLARAQLTGCHLSFDDARDRTVVYRSDRETLSWLEGSFWTDLASHHDLSPDEQRAAREVHRRILEAVDGDVTHYESDRDPFVRIERAIRRD